MLQLGEQIRAQRQSASISRQRVPGCSKTSGGDVAKAVTTTRKYHQPDADQSGNTGCAGQQHQRAGAQNAVTATFTTAPVLAAYTGHNGRTLAQSGCSIPFHSIPFHSIPFHSIPFHSIPFHSVGGNQ